MNMINQRKNWAFFAISSFACTLIFLLVVSVGTANAITATSDETNMMKGYNHTASMDMMLDQMHSKVSSGDGWSGAMHNGWGAKDGQHGKFCDRDGSKNDKVKGNDRFGMMKDGHDGRYCDRGKIGRSYGGHSFIGFAIVCLVTILLLWTLLVVLIIYFIQKIRNSSKPN